MMAHWERRAKTQTRIVPQLVQGGKFHGPVRAIKQIRTTSGVIEANNENWSGYAITGPWQFAKFGSRVEARFVVPTPASGCEAKSDTYSSANWVGIDGAFSNDVFTDRISGVQLFSIPHGSAKAAPALWFVATTPY
jgi:hypothetical protein